MAQPTLKSGVAGTPLDYEAFDGQLELVCRACGRKAKYSVGRIFIDLQLMKRVVAQEIPYREAAYFSGCFHCKGCGLGGPWDIPQSTAVRLTLLQVAAVGGNAPVQFGALQLFDGTPCHSGGEGEAHLQRLIAAEPANYFLWSRLGNLFNVAEDPERAFPAFQKAVELNPQDVESHHSLAEIHYEREEWEQAAEHYHQVLLHARNAPQRTREKPALLKSLVRRTLESLLDLRERTGGKIEFIPSRPPDPATPVPKEAVLVLSSFDLSKEDDWERLTNSFLDGELAGQTRQTPQPRAPRFSGYRFPAKEKERVGRNDPCPCGSGKKFKKCCNR